MYFLKIWILYEMFAYFLKISMLKNIRYQSRLESIQRKSNKQEKKTSQSLLEKVFVPSLKRLIDWVASYFSKNGQRDHHLQYKLDLVYGNMQTGTYRALIFLVSLSLSVMFMVFFKQSIKNSFLIFILAIVIQRFQLNMRLKTKKDAMRKQIPDVLDLLSVSVKARLSFYQALTYITDKMEGPLIEVFKEMQVEIAMGIPTSQAMNNVAKKTEIEDLKMFFSAVLQGESLGISLREILDTQSKMIRKKQRQMIEEKAAKIPVKILFPLIVFIFPVLFIVLLGPAIPGIKAALGGS